MSTSAEIVTPRREAALSEDLSRTNAKLLAFLSRVSALKQSKKKMGGGWVALVVIACVLLISLLVVSSINLKKNSEKDQCVI